jgi:hypothetical protein
MANNKSENTGINPFAKFARIFDSAGNEVIIEKVPLVQNAAGRWPPALMRNDVYYDHDETLSTANGGTPCYKQRTVS